MYDVQNYTLKRIKTINYLLFDIRFQLSLRIRPSSFTLEHIPASLSPRGDGKIPSAPKDFSVWVSTREFAPVGKSARKFHYNRIVTVLLKLQMTMIFSKSICFGSSCFNSLFVVYTIFLKEFHS